MAKKHIAVMGIKGLPSKGGGERVAEAIIYAALDNDFKVTVYGKKDYCVDIDVPRNLRIIKIRDIKGKHASAFTFGLFSSIHAMLFGSYDLIHLHYADFGYIVPLLRLRFKIIGTSHGAEYNRDKWNWFAKMFFMIVEVLFIKYTNQCTSVSKPLAEHYSKTYGREVLYIPNGIHFDNGLENEEKMLTSSVLQRYGLQPYNYILFAAGRIIPSKGCDILLKANHLLKLELPLVVIGDRNSDEKYKAYLEGLADSNVIFIDFVSSQTELFDLVSKSMFFVFPSAYEAMSMMLLEVASLKKGIVCSDIPENLEAVENNALYFKSMDFADLAAKISYALDHQKEMDALGEKAYKWILKNRNWKTITEKYLQLYSSI